MTLLATSEITISKRHRKDMGDIDALSRSITDVGMLQPVVITPENRLVAGARRLAAAKKIGMERVPVFVVRNLEDASKALRAERDENTCRKDFLPTEYVSLMDDLAKWESKAAKQRQENPGAGRGRPKLASGKLPEAKGDTRDRVAAAVGVSGRTYEKARAVVQAAKENPILAGDLVETMDRTGKVDRAFKELQRREIRADNKKLVEQAPIPTEAVNGRKYKTVVIDPPWDWGDEGDVDQYGRGTPTYATMPYEELLCLPVGELAERSAHLFLCITNRSLPKGFALMEAWGFRYITCLTWCKPSIGMGNYFRGSTEQILFGVRGSLSLLRSDVGTWFQAVRPGKHSGKPEEFYKLVESCSPGPWLEMFARGTRNGWAAWGAEV